jgi:pilus assembly protein CpaB
MNKRLSRILILAFIIAAVASFLVYRIAGKQANGPVQPATIKIMVAAHDLPIGTVIKDADLKEGAWVGAPPKGALGTKENLVGRGVISSLYEGEPILDSRLAPAGSGGGMAATIKPGMRAVAVRVDDVVGVSGFVVAGSHVDVLITGTRPGATGAAGPEVKTVLQNIEVLSAGTNIQKDNEGKPVQVPVVNLLLTPEQSEVLSLASTQTHIQLVLRNPLDTDSPKTPGVAVAGLFNGGVAPPKPQVVSARREPPKVVAPPAPPVAQTRIFLVEVMNGAKKSEEKFATTDHQ